MQIFKVHCGLLKQISKLNNLCMVCCVVCWKLSELIAPSRLHLCIGNFHKPTEYFVPSKRLLHVLRSLSIYRDVQQLTDTAEKKLLLFRKLPVRSWQG